MAKTKLIGFVKASDAVKNEAATTFTMTKSESPFTDGVEFKITDWGIVHSEYSSGVDKESRHFVFTTSINDDVYLFARALTRGKVVLEKDDNGIEQHTTVYPDGTFNLFVKQAKGLRNKNDFEFMARIVEECKDLTLIARPAIYYKRSTDNRVVEVTVLNIDFKDSDKLPTLS